MLTEAFVASFAATLFSMLNPIGGMGIFAGMTDDRSASETRSIAITTAIAIAVTLLIVAWFGTFFLSFFGISIASLKAAGGIIVLLIGLDMLFNKDHKGQSKEELSDAINRPSIAVVPLAIPITSGPGAIAAVLVTSNQHSSDLYRIEISLTIVAMAFLTGVLYSFAKPLSKAIGKSGMGVVSRVMGLVLTAIAMGLFTEGLTELLPGLGK